jgi:hypothetical protein
VYVSLRQELFDAIPDLYEDAQKYRDLLEIMSWTEDSLLKLIAKRIRHSSQKYGHNPRALDQAGDTACWNAVFATPPSHPVNNSFRYMIGRTLLRPREIIQFCTQTVETARERAATLPLPYAAISRAERTYSTERAKDIAAEYRFQYSGLISVFDVFRGRQRTLSRDDLELLCIELATGEIPTSGTASWLTDRNPADVIEILWSVGFLTAQPSGRPAPRHDEDRTFLGPQQAPHLNLAAVNYFQIHPMFRSYLDIAQQVRR